jgi:hypothetical protein
VISIDVLHDEVLLEIFHFYVDDAPINAWQSLVHVCRRWRSVVFGSPCRLNLRLKCTLRTPARDNLNVWPALPILIKEAIFLTSGLDNIVAALERSDRVCHIGLWGPYSPMEKLFEAMQVPFPELTDLILKLYGVTMSVFPDSFLGGLTPRLKTLQLGRIPFPGLPNLLSSTPHLIDLHLLNIPNSGYISSEVMVAALSTLTSLGSLKLEFEFPRSHPDPASQRLTRTVLPALKEFWFRGDNEYLEDLMTRIDAPRLNILYITFFDLILFDTPQFTQFINRTPSLKAFERAHITFDGIAAGASLSSQTSGHRLLDVRIPCGELNWQLLSLKRIITSSLPPLSTPEDLYISETDDLEPGWLETINSTLWLELLHPFSAVKNLYLSEKVAPHVVPVLQELVGGSATEVLPILQNIFLENLQPSGIVQEGVEQFIAMRQITSHPIAVSYWDRRIRVRRLIYKCRLLTFMVYLPPTNFFALVYWASLIYSPCMSRLMSRRIEATQP